MTDWQRTRLMVVSAIVVATGCNLGETCDTGIEPAIEVVIVDAITGEPLAENAAGVAQTGTFIDSLRPHRGEAGQLISRATTQAPPGTYEVRVTHDGYEPWSASNIRVSAGSCGPRTRRLTAELQPSGTP